MSRMREKFMCCLRICDYNQTTAFLLRLLVYVVLNIFSSFLFFFGFEGKWVFGQGMINVHSSNDDLYVGSLIIHSSFAPI